MNYFLSIELIHVVLQTYLHLTASLPDQVEAFSGSHFGGGMGPIFLDQLDCSGTESSLLQCRRFAELGLHSCDHSKDASIRCLGEFKICFSLSGGLNPYIL